MHDFSWLFYLKIILLFISNSSISYHFIWLLDWILLNHSKPKMHVIVNYHSLVPLNLSAQSSFMILCQLEFMFINFNFWLNNNNILKKNYSFMLCPEHSSKKSFIGMKKEVEPRLIAYLRVGRVDNVSKS